MTRRAIMTIPALVPGMRAAEPAEVRPRRVITDFRSAQKAPGMCTAVRKSDSIVWSEAFGVSDFKTEHRSHRRRVSESQTSIAAAFVTSLDFVKFAEPEAMALADVCLTLQALSKTSSASSSLDLGESP